MSTRREIRTNKADVSCDVCGRTLLGGEHPETYLAGGARRQVCELCTPRAVHEGWIREAASSGELPARAFGGVRTRSLLGRLRQRRDQELVDEEESRLGAEGVPARVAGPAARAEQPGRARESRQVHAVPTNNELKMARALELFNASRHRRMVAGLSRSLGLPVVCVRPAPEEPQVVALVVSWDLSWYRFEVDLADEDSGVRVVQQGQEVEELDPEHRAWNAAADDEGVLALTTRTA